ncbi:hypothetical protein F53441_4711 [Fusarium austroafricanum]|uniref:NB-ARC domain-containing protein n=1 Tax=Fusarium austroafricanum TaxID=2364996 RepID=A0A8H4P1F6_9HYPO|nr:hypothetical protein F53441_4711 [Fusarium austroafricanum]
MNGPAFSDHVHDSNVLTGFSAEGNAHQVLNFNYSTKSRPFYALPYEKNEDFVSRPDITSQLEEHLPVNSDDFQSAALWGLGGSGKTQVALEYAYSRYRKGSCSVFWVHADNGATFVHDYGTIAKVLGLNSQDNGHELLQSVRHKIESLKRWLLVLDNADDLSLFGVGSAASGSTSKFMDYIPKGPNGSILWTGRDEAIGGSLVGVRRSIQVSKMTPEESKTLLESTISRSANGTDLIGLSSLIEELQYLPLAISQAGAYMRRTDTSVSQYLSDLKEEQARWSVLKEPEFDRHRVQGNSNSILETWSISIRRLKQENHMAYVILHILAYFDNQNIPEPVIEAAAEYGEGNQTREMLENNRKRALRRLKDFSFLRERRLNDNERNFEMHKLVQDAARYGLHIADISEKDERKPIKESRKLRNWLRRCFKTSENGNVASAKGEKYFAGAAIDIIEGLYPMWKEIDKGKTVWPGCERYLAHAQRVCHWAESFGKDESAIGVSLRCCGYLQQCGRVEESIPLLQHTLGTSRRAFGERSDAFTNTLRYLAASFLRTEQYQQSIDSGIKALQLLSESEGEKDDFMVECMSLLSTSYLKQKRLGEAESFAMEALRQAREKSCDDVTTLFSMGAMADVYNEQERYEDAINLLLEAIESYQPKFGNLVPWMIPIYDRLGYAYTKQSKFDKAEEAYSRALQLCLEVYGDEHLDTINTNSSVAITWAYRGKHEESLQKITDCCQLSEKLFGADHARTGSLRSHRDWIVELNEHNE